MKKTEDKNIIIEEIKLLLNNADSLRETNIVEAINILYDAGFKVDGIKLDDKMSQRIQTEKKGNLEITYLSKKANVLYEIEEYQHALEIYEEIRKKTPSSFSIQRSIADCYRKMGKFDDALAKYEEALKKYENDSSASLIDEAGILNNKGLTCAEKAEENLSIKDLEQGLALVMKAIEKNPNNPVYHCNSGKILYSLDKKDLAIEHFNKAKELVQSGKIGDELNSDNISYINNTLSGFIEFVDKLNSVSLSKKDAVIHKREVAFMGKIIDSLGNYIIGQEIESELKKIIDTKNNLKIIESNRKLYEYYDGFIFNINKSYVTAMVVNSDTFQINTDSLAADIPAKLISFIPLVGNIVSEGIKIIKDISIIQKVKFAANNVCKFSRSITEFETMSQDAVIDIILEKREELEKIDPEAIVLKQWSNKFKKNSQKNKRKYRNKTLWK
jgi:tetratricopeptide (TPR) repeat protein